MGQVYLGLCDPGPNLVRGQFLFELLQQMILPDPKRGSQSRKHRGLEILCEVSELF